MLNGNQVFAQSVGRLNEIYKNDPARLEAIKDMTTIALEAFGDAPGLGSSMGLSTVDTHPHHSTSYSNASGSATATPAPSKSDVDQAMEVIRQYAKSNPIECQRWLNDVLNNDIRNAAQYKLSNLSDDWEQAFNDEVSGKADKDREATSKKLAEEENKKKQKEMGDVADSYFDSLGSDDDDTGLPDSKETKTAKRKQYHSDALKKMDEEDAEYEKQREKDKRDGNDPNMYRDTKKRGFFTNLGRKAKRLWHHLRESAEQAMREGDMAKLESIRCQMLNLKSLCESAGLDVNNILVG